MIFYTWRQLLNSSHGKRTWSILHWVSSLQMRWVQCKGMHNWNQGRIISIIRGPTMGWILSGSTFHLCPLPSQRSMNSGGPDCVWLDTVSLAWSLDHEGVLSSNSLLLWFHLQSLIQQQHTASMHLDHKHNSFLLLASCIPTRLQACIDT